MNRGMAAKGADSLSLAAVCCVMPSRAIVGIVGVGKEAQVGHSSGSSHPSFHLRWDVGFPLEKRLVRVVRHFDKSG